MTVAPQAPRKLLEKDYQDDGFYEQYSPHHELPYSSLASFAFHFCLMLLLPLLASAFRPEDRLPPAVEVVAVTDSLDDSGETGDGLPKAGPLETNDESSDVPLPATEPQVEVNEVQEADVDETDIEKLTQEIQQEVTETTNQGQKIAASAAERLANATSQLNENIGGGGGTGTGGAGRQGRAARWILHFDTRSAKDYIEQFGGLGAEIAFPQRGDRWLFFDLTKSPPVSESRDLSGENRIYWVDDDPQSVGGVSAELGISPTEFMIAFLPVPLENEMLQMELSYKGAQSEDDVVQTQFKVVPRGGGYSVIVVDQKLKNE